MKKLSILIALLLITSSVTEASLTKYEQMLTKSVVRVMKSKQINSLEDFDLKAYRYHYFSKVDQQKYDEIKAEIDRLLAGTITQKNTVQPESTTTQIITTEGKQGKVAVKTALVASGSGEQTAYPRAIATAIEKGGNTLNYTKIQQTRMKWLNDMRVGRGLGEIVYDTRLEYTADQWNRVMISRDQWSHQRTVGDSFFDYKKISKRFEDLGLTFKVKGRSTFTENVGVRRGRSCKDEECSDEVIVQLRKIFDFYMAEEGTKNDAHFKSMIGPNYTIGGLAFDISASKKLYFTVHYATEIITPPVSN